MNNDPFVYSSTPFPEPQKKSTLETAKTCLDLGYVDRAVRMLIERVEQLEEALVEINSRIEIRD